MKAWIGLKVKSDNQDLLSAVGDALPSMSDNRLWDSNENGASRNFEPDGTEVVCASLFFNDFSERATLKATLSVIDGFLSIPVSSGYLKTAKSYHDELLPNGCPAREDEIEESEVVS